MTTELSPECEQLRTAAIASPSGHLTIMLVNRYDREIEVQLVINDSPVERSLRTFRYTPEILASAGEFLPQESSTAVTPANGSMSIPLPAQTFALLTDIPADAD